MNANELADSLEAASSDMEYNFHVSDWKLLYECALVMRKQQAEIEALKKSCLDEIFKRTYANQSAKVMEGYWQEAQAEIEALKNILSEIDRQVFNIELRDDGTMTPVIRMEKP